jgi:inner membrane protein
MDWWIWVLFGLVLCLAELTTPGGFYIIFFGASAIGIGILELTGIVSATWLQWFLFSALSIAAVFLLRSPMKEKFQSDIPDANSDNLSGDTASASEDIAIGSVGQVRLRGTTWRAENVGDTPIEKGETCRIDHVDGVTLKVCKDGS